MGCHILQFHEILDPLKVASRSVLPSQALARRGGLICSVTDDLHPSLCVEDEL